MSGMALASIPCLACVIGLDVRHGSVERAVFRRLLSVVEVAWLGYMLGTVPASILCLDVY